MEKTPQATVVHSQIPVAQYLRMSSDRQQYSLTNQAEAITQFACTHGYQIVETYTDGGKSGLTTKGRSGIRRLLESVLSGKTPFRAILVYDVSRWGRYQNTDEAAHYEFLCNAAGIEVIYCAEPFTNQGNTASTIVKALKRAMAAEFSRELSTRIFAAKARLAMQGFWTCGSAGYGFRRCAVLPNGKRCVLRSNEYKPLPSARIVLVPGPPEEIRCVRRIYSMALAGKSFRFIADRLNQESIPFQRHKAWEPHTIKNLLRDPKFTGELVWGRTSAKLGGSTIAVPRENWIRKLDAFPSIISKALFADVQRALENRTKLKSNLQLILDFKHFLRSNTKLTSRIIDRTKALPTMRTIKARFGSLEQLYKALNYHPRRRDFRLSQSEIALNGLRASISRELACAVSAVTIENADGLVPRVFVNGRKLTISICRARGVESRKRLWTYYGRVEHRDHLVLLCLLDKGNAHVAHYFLCSGALRVGTLRLGIGYPRLTRCIRLQSIRELPSAVETLGRQRPALDQGA